MAGERGRRHGRSGVGNRRRGGGRCVDPGCHRRRCSGDDRRVDRRGRRFGCGNGRGRWRCGRGASEARGSGSRGFRRRRGRGRRRGGRHDGWRRCRRSRGLVDAHDRGGGCRHRQRRRRPHGGGERHAGAFQEEPQHGERHDGRLQVGGVRHQAEHLAAAQDRAARGTFANTEVHEIERVVLSRVAARGRGERSHVGIAEQLHRLAAQRERIAAVHDLERCGVGRHVAPHAEQPEAVAVLLVQLDDFGDGDRRLVRVGVEGDGEPGAGNDVRRGEDGGNRPIGAQCHDEAAAAQRLVAAGADDEHHRIELGFVDPLCPRAPVRAEQREHDRAGNKPRQSCPEPLLLRRAAQQAPEHPHRLTIRFTRCGRMHGVSAPTTRRTLPRTRPPPLPASSRPDHDRPSGTP